MAEVRPFEDYEFDVSIPQDLPTPKPRQIETEPEREVETRSKTRVKTEEPEAPTVTPLVLPHKKMRVISHLEKLTFLALVLVTIGIAMVSIYLSTAITAQTEEIKQIQQKVENSTENIVRLQQEKSELLRTDRVKGIANKAGLKLIDENIRKVSR